MKVSDLTLGLLVLVGAVALLLSSLGFSPIPGQAYGADTMPKAIGTVALILSLVLIARALRAGERVPRVSFADWAGSPRSVATLVLTLALVVAYIVLADIIGFIPVATGILVVLMLALGIRPLTAVIVAIVAAIAVQFAFGRLLLVPLPRSPFLEWLW